MSKYKNIIFDLGGVLLNIDYNRTRKAFEELGIKNFDTLYSQAAANDLFQRLEKGTISVPTFYKQLNEYTGLNLSIDAINEAWNAMLLDFREPSLDYLQTLKPRAGLILLSNTNAIHKAAFDAIYLSGHRDRSFEDYFQHCIFSFETGTRKPDAECYQFALNTAGIKAEETIFIDDSIQNIESAARLGIHSILLEKGNYIENLGLENLVK